MFFGGEDITADQKTQKRAELFEFMIIVDLRARPDYDVRQSAD